MEITNNSRYYSIPLVVGRRVAQIVFFDTEGIVAKSYEREGKYQSTADVAQLMREWQPRAMLPRMYCDKEVAALLH
jgi:dCTP deaminase